jgi:hypothetical protein
MRPNRLLIAATCCALSTAVFGQATTDGSVPSGSTTGGVAATQGPVSAGPANTGGVIPVVPPVQEPGAAPNAGANEGFFRPSPDAVVVPPFSPTTPGVTPIDTRTNATVGSSTADRELRDSVASAIAADPQMQGARVNVLVKDGVVTLSGTASNREQIERARAITERLAGSAQVTASITTPG